MKNTNKKSKIDAIDEEIIKLLAERVQVLDEAEESEKKALPIEDLRERKQKIMALAAEYPEEMRDYIPVVVNLLNEMKGTKTRTNGVKGTLAGKIDRAKNETPKLFPDYVTVACQGTEGANSQIACDRIFRNSDIMFFSNFDAVFTSIEKGLCEYGVIPVENSSAGTVNKVYDLMMKHNFYIVRSIRLKITHHLLAKPGTKLENVKEIYSHEQAISQCSEYLSGLKGVKIIPFENTAQAAKMVAESDRDDIAALASELCVKYYGLETLAASVQNTDNNYTRFICISKNLEVYPGADRTSLMLILPHEYGSLYKVLSKFHMLGINLLKLESRPLPNKEFEFMFYFDIEIPAENPKLLQLMNELGEVCDSFTYLGSYHEMI
ncbi:MAG: chorismate mutase [Lachnospiraceae bacterium]|nr:chorismate mutase [Lachnospiraceae bacterium]